MDQGVGETTLPRVGVALGSRTRLDFSELVAVAETATRLGFDSIWTPRRSVPDSFFICLGWWDRARRVAPRGIDVGIGVVPAPGLWHPASLATQAASLSFLTGGRFLLGIGTGGYGPGFWESIGLPNRPVAVMADYIEALRSAFRGGRVDYRGRVVHLRDFALERVPPPVPIYLAAMGPQMLRLGGRLADGVLMNWMSPARLAESIRTIEGGIASAGRPRDDVSIALFLRCAVDDDPDVARRFMATEVLEKLAPAARRSGLAEASGYPGQFARLGFASEVAYLERRFESGASIGELLDEVPIELCQAAGYVGDARGAAAAVARMVGGVDHVIIRIVTAGHTKTEELMAALTPENIRRELTRAAEAQKGATPDQTIVRPESSSTS